MGSLFDANQLAYISKGDTAMETRVGEAILIRSLENMLNSVNQDLENCESRSLAIISALATIIKVNLENEMSFFFQNSYIFFFMLL